MIIKPANDSTHEYKHISLGDVRIHFPVLDIIYWIFVVAMIVMVGWYIQNWRSQKKAVKTADLLQETQQDLESSKERNDHYPLKIYTNDADAWGRPWMYRMTRDGQDYVLASRGPDGMPLTADDIQAWWIPNHEWQQPVAANSPAP